jgi:catechol 2,3-dioxygenase-like lactoylglutathione lyase family enzyme
VSIDVDGLDHVAFAVADQSASAAWYRRLLGLQSVHEETWGGVPMMLVGNGGTGLALFQARQDRPGGFRHVALRVTRSQYEAAKRQFLDEGIPFDEQDHTVSWSVYFRDPDGIELELTTYEV